MSLFDRHAHPSLRVLRGRRRRVTRQSTSRRWERTKKQEQTWLRRIAVRRGGGVCGGAEIKGHSSSLFYGVGGGGYPMIPELIRRNIPQRNVSNVYDGRRKGTFELERKAWSVIKQRYNLPGSDVPIKPHIAHR